MRNLKKQRALEAQIHAYRKSQSTGSGDVARACPPTSSSRMSESRHPSGIAGFYVPADWSQSEIDLLDDIAARATTRNHVRLIIPNPLRLGLEHCTPHAN